MSTDGGILLVEDNEDDVFIFTRAYKHAQLPYRVQVARTGREAIEHLLGEGKYAGDANHALPFLVLLDLKLPGTPGLEVLKTIRSHPKLAGVRVVVLTSSAEARDILRAHTLGALAFLVKPPSAPVLSGAIAAVLARFENPEAAPKVPGDMFDVALRPVERGPVSPAI